MTKEELYAHPGWRWSTWEGSQEFDRLHDLRLTFREQLEWQEEMENLALQFRANREQREREEALQRASQS